MYKIPVVPSSAITRRGTMLRLWKQVRTRASAPGSASALTRRQSACVGHSSGASDSACSWVMGSVPHRICTSIERTAAPAFGESRAGNRPDLVADETHHGYQYARAAPTTQNCTTARSNRLYPAAIHDVMLIRAGARLLGGEKDDELRDLHRLELALQALPDHDLRLRLRRDPLLQLTLGHDPTGSDGVDAYSVTSEISREGPRQTQHGRLRRRVARHTALADDPRDRPEVDDRAV